MEGYRQTLLGRALADALQDLEKQRGGDDDETGVSGVEVDGDLLFLLFDESMQLELQKRCKGQERTFTHDSFGLEGRVTAFNRFMDDWSVLARMKPQDIRLNHSVAGLHLQQQNQEQHEEQEVAMRLKLSKKP